MKSFVQSFQFGIYLLILLGFFPGCKKETSPSASTLVLGAYTTPREAFREINVRFKEAWKKKTGQSVEIQESYLGSGAQSRAVVDGFAADVVALSLETDVERIAKAGLITHPWRQGPSGGMLTQSIVAFTVRQGNPKKILDWRDLLNPEVKILTPNPKTSGGAQWNILAAFGAALRGHVEGFSKDFSGATQFLERWLPHVVAMDKGARESMLTFEKGVGDVALTYENEILGGQAAGSSYEMVVPSSTILIECPVALVDKNVEKHGNRQLAEAYVDFLFSEEAQEIFVKHGFRPLHPKVKEKYGGKFPVVKDLFTVQVFGGWERIQNDFFGKEGIFTKAVEKERF